MEIWIIDAFTTTRFRGNPAAVAVVDVFPADSEMLAIAAEMNLSETCFVKKIGENHYHIRWFTPLVEVRLCGHATLAAAFVLKSYFHVLTDNLVFESLSGPLLIDVLGDKIRLSFPSAVTTSIPIDTHIGKALGNEAVVAAVVGPEHDSFLIYVYKSQACLSALTPNFMALQAATPHAIIVTAPGELGYDYALRVFAPQYGVSEDPVTGSAQVLLADYWRRRLDKTQFNVVQVSKRRGELYVAHLDTRVLVSGAAVLVAKTVFLDGLP